MILVCKTSTISHLVLLLQVVGAVSVAPLKLDARHLGLAVLLISPQAAGGSGGHGAAGQGSGGKEGAAGGQDARQDEGDAVVHDGQGVGGVSKGLVRQVFV